MADPTVNPSTHASDQQCLSYSQYDWCDCIYGSKAQLQAIGIGIGVAFPGEPGAAKRKIRTTDQRGFRVEVKAERAGVFCAYVYFPGWPDSPSHKSHQTEAFPGVLRHEEPWSDIYTGDAADLIAAGLVKADQFPGLPGMRKLFVSIQANGRVVNSPATSPVKDGMGEGSKRIERAGKKFQVKVRISDTEHSRRFAKCQREQYEWRRLARSLPRPSRLDQLHSPVNVGAQRQRGHLRLVWSAA